jgi:hypothetical protein
MTQKHCSGMQRNNEVVGTRRVQSVSLILDNVNLGQPSPENSCRGGRIRPPSSAPDLAAPTRANYALVARYSQTRRSVSRCESFKVRNSNP